jgi:hypothetical protein
MRGSGFARLDECYSSARSLFRQSGRIRVPNAGNVRMGGFPGFRLQIPNSNPENGNSLSPEEAAAR